MVPFTPPPIETCLAFVLAGGRGSRLHELTAADCKPAVSFAGSCRIIDFALANTLNSGMRQALVATQYQPARLVSHLRSRWRSRFAAFGGTISTLSSGTEDEAHGYRGTADAVYRNIAAIDALAPRHVLVLAADHVYQMDYAKILASHVGCGADVTIAADIVPAEAASGFGVLGTDRRDRIVDFVEKPAVPPTLPDRPDRALASMGIYVFDWLLLREVLIEDARDAASSRDFGKDILPRLIARGNAFVHRFTAPGAEARPGYWRDVGTLDALHQANMDLLEGAGGPRLDLENWPLHVGWMGGRFTPGSAHAGSLVYPGSEPASALLHRSVVGPLVTLGAGACVRRSVLMPGAAVDAGIRVRNAIIAPGVRLSGAIAIGEDGDEDALWFRRTQNGVVLVDQPMLERRARMRRVVRGWNAGVEPSLAARLSARSG